MLEFDEIEYRVKDAIISIQEEKQDELQKYIVLVNLLSIIFINNEYLSNALDNINENIAIYFDDLDFEHKSYEKILSFMNKNKSKIDISILELIDDILNTFGNIFENRMISFAQFITYYNTLVQMNNLNKITYSYPKYKSLIKEEDKKKILSSIIEV